MLTHEHVRTSQGFLLKAESEFAVGDILQGSEKLWGAATHAIMANAQLRGWSFGSHRAMPTTVEGLPGEHGDDSLLDGFGVAEKCHANFYHDFMEDHELERARRSVPRFVNRLLALVPGNEGAQF